MTRALCFLVIATAALALWLPGRDTGATGIVSTVTASDHLALVPLGGLRQSGITLTASVGAGDIVLSVSNGMPFTADQALEIKPAVGPTELMKVVSATGDGDPSNDGTGGIQERVTVLRGQFGTSAIAHAMTDTLYSEFSRFDVRADQLAPRNTNTTLTAMLDAGTFDATPGMISYPPTGATASDTTIYVSDATVVNQGDAIKIDNEQMTVSDARRGYVGDGTPPVQNGTGVLLSGNINNVVTTFNVAGDTSKLTNGWRIKVDSEEMLLQNHTSNQLTVVRGYNGTSAASHSPFKPVLTGLVEVSNDFDQLLTTTTVNISDKNPLALGNIALIDNEEFLITATSGDGFGGAQDTMTVVRAYDSTINVPHLAGAAVYSGRDRMVVVRAQNGTTAASHLILAPIQSVGRIASVSNQGNLTSSSTLLIDAERLKVLATPVTTLHTSGATVGTGGITNSSTLLPLSSITGLSAGQTIAVDSERMAITTEAPACNVTSGFQAAQSLSATPGTGVVVNVNDITKITSFTLSCSIKADSEEMLVTDIAGDGAGGMQDTIKVTRPWNDTTVAAHSSIVALVAGRSAARVFRGLHGTTAASHSSAAAVSTVSEEANKVRLSRAEPGGGAAATHNSGAMISDVDGLAGYVFTTSFAAPTVVTTTDPMDTVVTDVGVSSTAPLQIGWVVIIDGEKMKITNLHPASPAFMSVQRAYAGTAAATHSIGAAVRGPVLAELTYANNGPIVTETGRVLNTLSCGPATMIRGLESLNYSCATDGLTPLGPIADNMQPLATLDIIPRVLLPSTPTKALTVTGALADVTGDDLSAAFTSGTVRVVRCPDVNADRVANFPGDVLNIAKASFNIIPPVLPKMDINNDNFINFPGDAIVAAKVVILGQPGGLRCTP